MKSASLVFATLLWSHNALVAAVESFIIENGQRHAEIIIAERPARMTKLAAKKLQSTLFKMTGATHTLTASDSLTLRPPARMLNELLGALRR